MSSILGVCSLLLLGCGSPSGGEWTVQKGDLDLTETLRLAEGENFYFGEVSDVAVREDGRIYVADGKAAHIKVLAPDGTLRDTIGQRGEGPGEFRRPTRIGFTKGDSLYVSDGRQVSVFSPSGGFQYAFRTQATEAATIPRKMMVRPDGGGSLFAFLPLPRALAQEKIRAAVRPVGSDGTLGRRLFAVLPRQAGPDGRPIPFSRRPAFAQGPEGFVHYAWTDSLHVTVYDWAGTQQRDTLIPFEPVPVTEADQKRVLSDQSKDIRAAIKGELPSTKPAFEQFLIDDLGRYWFGRPTAHPDTTAWWMAFPEGKRVGTTKLPAATARPGGVRVLTIRDGRVYGRTTTENGAPALVRYRVEVGL